MALDRVQKLRNIALFFVGIILPASYAIADKTTKSMIGQIDYLQNRHATLAENIANSSTPKYKAQELERPDFLDGKSKKVKISKVRIKTTNSKHIRPPKSLKKDKYELQNDNSGVMKPNKNNVDLSKQVQKLSSNSDEMNIALKNYKSAIDLISTAADPGTGGHR